MAQVLIVAYELHREPTSKDYQSIVSIIKKYDYLKIGGSEYFIYTNDSPDTIVDKIKPYFESNEKLIVIKVSNPKQGLLTEEQWKWLNARL